MKRSLRMILCLFLVMLFIPLLSLTASAEDSGAVLNFLDFSIADTCTFFNNVQNIEQFELIRICFELNDDFIYVIK